MPHANVSSDISYRLMNVFYVLMSFQTANFVNLGHFVCSVHKLSSSLMMGNHAVAHKIMRLRMVNVYKMKI